MGNRPTEIPLVLRAPELVFNEISLGVVDQDWAPCIDVWALGCLVSCLLLPEFRCFMMTQWLYEIIAQNSVMSFYCNDLNDLCTQDV